MKSVVPAWSVVVAVPNKHGSFLAISRGFAVRDPALPGGDSEDTDATPAQTAAREVFEETGVRVLDLKCIDSWQGDRGQPVYAFVAGHWRGKRLRTSAEGKPFWASPRGLTQKTAYYREEARRVFEKLSQMDLQEAG